MKYRYIAIEREYGSGGTQIGKEVANKLGIACCTTDIYEKVGTELGLTAEEVAKREESTTNSLLYSLAMLAGAQTGNENILSTEQKIHLVMQKEIQELANKGPCVFVGHCAMEALKKRNDVLRVFIRADNTSKILRIFDEYGIPKDSVEKIKDKHDRRRRNTFHSYTAKKWEDPANYELVMDSGKLGIEKCVEILVGLMN